MPTLAEMLAQTDAELGTKPSSLSSMLAQTESEIQNPQATMRPISDGEAEAAAAESTKQDFINRFGGVGGRILSAPIVREVVGGFGAGMKGIGQGYAQLGAYAGVPGAQDATNELANERQNIRTDARTLGGNALPANVLTGLSEVVPQAAEMMTGGGIVRRAATLVPGATRALTPTVIGTTVGGTLAAKSGAANAEQNAIQEGLTGDARRNYVLRSALIEGGITALGGTAGLEALAAGRQGTELIKSGISNWLRQVAPAAARGAGSEVIEENAVNLAQLFNDYASLPSNQGRPMGDLWSEWASSIPETSLVAGIAGGFGGAMGARPSDGAYQDAQAQVQIQDQAQSRAALTAMDPNVQKAQPTTPPRLWEDIQRQQVNAQQQEQLNAIDPRTQQIADEEVDAASVAALNDQRNVEQNDLLTRQQQEQERARFAQAQAEDMRRADQEAEQLTNELKQLEIEKRQREQADALNEVQDLSNRLAAFEKETAAVENPDATVKARAQFEIDQQRAALNEMRKELEAQRQQSAPLPDTQDDIIDAVGRAGGIQVPGRDAQGEFDAYRALPSSVKRLIAGKRSKLPEKELPPGTLNAPTLKIRPGSKIDVVAKTVMDQDGLGDGTTDTLIKLVARAAKERAARSRKAEAPTLSAEESYREGVKLSRPQAKAIEPKPADTTVDKRIAANLRSRLEAAKARLASLQATRQAPAPVAPKPVVKTASPTEANAEASNRLQALNEEEGARQDLIAPQPREKAPEPTSAPQQTQQTKPPAPVEPKQAQPVKKSGSVTVKGMEDVYHGFREIYGLEKDQANVAVALVRARAAALDEDPDAYAARTIAEIRQGKGSPSLNQRGRPVTTLDQGERLIPKTKLLTFEYLKKQWAKAHGDKEPVGGSQAWHDLREKADKIDEERAARKIKERAAKGLDFADQPYEGLSDEAKSWLGRLSPERAKLLESSIKYTQANPDPNGDKRNLEWVLSIEDKTYKIGDADTLYQDGNDLPDTIEIDGKQRPTLNSDGKPIAQTEEAVRNFWAWFGDSKVVDKQGRPLVVYHGSESNITEYNDGSFFALDKDIARLYGDNVTDVYVKADELLRAKSADDVLSAIADSHWIDSNSGKAVNYYKGKFTQELLWEVSRDNASRGARSLYNAISSGFDAVFFTDDAYGRNIGTVDHESYFVLNGSNVKSATGNTGEFSAENPSILHQSLNDAPGGRGTEKGAISFQADSRAILHALKSPDISTGTHELFHSFRRTLTGKDADIAARYSGAKKDKSGTWFWDRGAEEKFARAAERFTRDGHIPVKALHSVFAKLSKWMREIYTSIKGTPIDQMISPEMRGVFERMLTPANEARGKQLEQGLASDEARVDTPRTKPADIIAKELTTDGKPAIQRKRVSTATKEDLPSDSDAVYDPLYGTIQIGENVTTERAAAIAQQIKDQESIDLTGKKVEVEVNGKTVQVDARAATTMIRKRLVALRSLLDCLG